jgi:hypothetical protein
MDFGTPNARFRAAMTSKEPKFACSLAKGRNATNASARTLGRGRLSTASPSSGATLTSRAAADATRSEARAVVPLYRHAVAELFVPSDIEAAVIGPFWRGYARTAELLVAVADRLWYIVLADV